jgi:hypothetical protein
LCETFSAIKGAGIRLRRVATMPLATADRALALPGGTAPQRCKVIMSYPGKLVRAARDLRSAAQRQPHREPRSLPRAPPNRRSSAGRHLGRSRRRQISCPVRCRGPHLLPVADAISAHIARQVGQAATRLMAVRSRPTRSWRCSKHSACSVPSCSRWCPGRPARWPRQPCSWACRRPCWPADRPGPCSQDRSASRAPLMSPADRPARHPGDTSSRQPAGRRPGWAAARISPAAALRAE